MVGFCVNPSYSFERKSVGNQVSSVGSGRVVLDFEITVGSDLIRFIDGLDNNSDTTFIVRIFGVISVQVTDSLLGSVFLLDPILYEILNLSNIHKLNVIHVSVLLPFNHNIGRNTLVTHGLWIRLMVLAFCVHLISNLRGWKTIVAFYITWMDAFTLQFFLFQKVIERNVRRIRNKTFIKAVYTLRVGPMLTKPLHLLIFVF